MRIELSGAVQFADKNFVHRTISTIQHQASEAAVNNIAECSEINANENCNSETEKEIVTVISSSETVIRNSETEKEIVPRLKSQIVLKAFLEL